MKISSEIASASEIVGGERTVEYMAKAGFDAWDLSMTRILKHSSNGSFELAEHPLAGRNAVKYVRELKKIGLDNGIVCNQSHAPFPVSDKTVRTFLKRAIELTAEAGGEICVIHPDNNKGHEENAEMYNELLPFAKACGVKIATENMWNWPSVSLHAVPAACSSPESFNAHLDAVNDEFFVACLDIGHAEMLGMNTSAKEMIYALGNRIGALHIHDNDKIHDSHGLPFSMNIDFNEVVAALKKINYSGYFTLEADCYLSKESFDKSNIFDGIKNLAGSARRLADMYEAL